MKRFTIKVLISLFFSLYACISFAEKSKVIASLEALPPLVNQDGSGIVIDMLNEIEQVSNYKFDVAIMTYARAKRQLKSAQAQLVGLTPKNSETDEFYEFAIELNWNVLVSVDLFVTDKAMLENYKEIYIGVPTGNADFFSELFDIPRKNFVEVTSLPQLAQMLNKNRIDAILFERIAIAKTFQKTGFKEVYYRQINITAASLAVANTPIGNILKTQLDYYIDKIDTQKVFQSYNDYLALPKTGNIEEITNLLGRDSKTRK